MIKSIETEIFQVCRADKVTSSAQHFDCRVSFDKDCLGALVICKIYIKISLREIFYGN